MNKPSAYGVYLLLNGLSALARSMIFTVAAVYYVTVVGLNPFQLVFVGTTLMVVILFSEVPTGIIADVYSRRLSIIIGVFLIGVGFLLEGSIPRFEAVLASQLIWGVGFTFTSGASEAWIADELGEHNLGPVYIRGAQASQLGALIGIGVSVALASIRLNLPIMGAGLLLIALAGLLVVVMPERGFRPTRHEPRNPLYLARETFRGGLQLVRRRPVLLTIFSIAFFFGMASETFDRLWEVHFLANFQFPDLGRLEPVVWFGIINAGALLLTLGVAEVVRRRIDTNSHLGAVRALFVINTLLMVSVFTFGLAANFGMALAAYWSAYLLRRTDGPIFTAWINQSLDPNVRATVLSMHGQIDAIGQIAGGPLFGLIATAASTRTAMVAASLVLVPALVLYLRAMLRGPLEPELAYEG